MTCGRAQEFLAAKKINPLAVADAKKERLGPKDALKLAEAVAEIYVAKGKKVIRFDMKKDPPSRDELLGALLGPSGNLRAPTMRSGKMLLVGFEPDAFAKLLR